MPTTRELPNGRWRVQWRDAAGNWCSPDPPQSFATKTMARQFGQDREAEIRLGTARDPKAGRVLLKDWAGEWIENRVAEPRTLTKMKGHLDKYVLAGVGGKGALGDMRLEQVDEMALQSWVKRLQDTGLEPGTIHGIFTTLGSVLRAAVRARKLVYDPTDSVRLPTIPPPSDFYWEREEIDAIRAQLDAPMDRAVFELLIGTGVRWGEAAGLHLPRWQPLRRRLTVVDVLEEDGGMRLKAYPKGKRARELPAVAPELLEAMAAHLTETPARSCGLDHGKGKQCPGIVFWWTVGRRHRIGQPSPLSRHVWPRDVFYPALQAAGVRPGTVHDLRHTYASWLALDGVSMRVIQALLGHASIRTTERYSHLSPATLDDPMLLASLKGQTAADRDAKRDADLQRQAAETG